MSEPNAGTVAFRAARDLLLRCRDEYQAARSQFVAWPELTEFNWALDWFDVIAAEGYYHTGDVASRDGDGYITYVGRTDDVFKASDYRISPFELESVLIEHEAVAEAAVVPSPDPLRLAVPKAYVVLTAGTEPSADTARSILAYARQRLAPFKRLRRIEFADLPKTISGKIRRVELRGREEARHASPATAARGATEFWEEGFADLKD